MNELKLELLTNAIASSKLSKISWKFLDLNESVAAYSSVLVTGEQWYLHVNGFVLVVNAEKW